MKIIAVALGLMLMSAHALAGTEPDSPNPSAKIVNELSVLQGEVKSVRAPFSQKKHTELLMRPVKSKGTFYFKRGAGVRWVYDGQMVVIYDNSTLYLHYIELGEAEKVRGITGFSGPLSFNVRELMKDYTIKADRAPDGRTMLELLPRERMPFKMMKMGFNKGEPFPHEVRVIEETGDETVITFLDPEYNVKLKDSLFRFKPPRGVKVTERDYEAE